MSLWHSIKPGGIEINYHDREIELLAWFDHNGNNYIVLTFEQFVEIYNQINGS